MRLSLCQRRFPCEDGGEEEDAAGEDSYWSGAIGMTIVKVEPTPTSLVTSMRPS